MAKESIVNRCLLARRPVGGTKTASGRDEEKRRGLVPSESDVWQRERSFEDKIWVVFVAELNCGKLCRGRSLKSKCLPARRPVGGARTVSDRDEEKRRIFKCRQKATLSSERATLKTKFGSFLLGN